MNPLLLLLDDDRDFANAIAERCKSIHTDIDVVQVESCSEAIASIILQKPDVICLDVDLTSENGLTFCEYLAWNANFRSIPVIIMTNRSDHDHIRRSCTLENLQLVDKSARCWDSLSFAIAVALGFQSFHPPSLAAGEVETNPSAIPAPIAIPATHTATPKV